MTIEPTLNIIQDLIGTSPVPSLAAAFSKAGKALYIVGGSVRDAILDREIHDLDLTTDALPDEIKRLLDEAGADNVFAIGEKFGTITGVFDGIAVEITTFRSESYDEQSRKPEVTFGDSLEADLSRRDFTMNAMAVDVQNGDLYDPFGGMQDIARRWIKAVGRPLDRFREDPLRTLRAIRLATQLRFVIEYETQCDLINQAEHLQWISQERIEQEMTKLLLAEKPSIGIRMLCSLGVMDFIIPEILDMRGMDQGKAHHKDVYEHTLAVVDKMPPIRTQRWAGLLHDIAKPCTRSFDADGVHFYQHESIGERMTHIILRRMRFDRDTVWHVGRVVGMHMWANSYTEEWTKGATRRFIREAGNYLEDLLQLSAADVTTLRADRKKIAADRVAALRARVEGLMVEESVMTLDSPLDGDELMAKYGMPPGPWIRTIKESLLSAVLDGDLGEDDKERAWELADSLVEGMQAAV